MRLQSCVFRLIARGCHLRHTARTLHGQVNVRVSRGANNCHVPRQGSAAFKKTQCETIWSLAVLAYQANCFFLQLGPQQLQKLEQRDRSVCDACLQTRLCRPRASTGEPHRQRCGTHKSSPRRKPTATLTAP